MRFAIKTSPQNTTWADMLAVWQAADDIDFFESGWTFDHFYPIFSDPTGPCLEGWITLTALAQATRRLRLGVLVTGNVYRHPAVLANMAATVDIISGGRLELGLGAAWNQEECDAYGIDLPPLKERFDRFDEALEVITGLLRNETTTFEGQHYQLRDARCEPKPVQRPFPPICIGGGGEKRTLRAVARHAQHWNAPSGNAAEFVRKREILAGHCADIGRDVSEIMTSTHMRPGPDGDLGPLVEQAEAFADAGLDLGIVYLAPPHRPDVLEPIAKALAHLG
ncbi:MAG TPA: LLM class F420-dependent oxidoreductase [Acidimicrobiales bacterium]|nr:LLM class F420-dependent oxidoreductase [Acidimicrobiales bacterium]